jgi:hypothetical protein
MSNSTSGATGARSTNTQRPPFQKSPVWTRSTVCPSASAKGVSDDSCGATLRSAVVYNDSSRRPDPAAFSTLELWHSDVTYELQPPSTTTLKLITGPEVGGDTLWSSGYALYSSLSPGFQAYLEGLSAVHSAVAQANGARAAGLPVRREPVETTHPVVRVHPATGWKSVYVNPGRCAERRPYLCVSRPAAADRLHDANSRRSQGRIRRDPRVPICPDRPEPHFACPLQMGAERRRDLG